MTSAESPLVLAIDLGTSGPKVALASPQGQIMAGVVEPTPVSFVADGGVEQDPEHWWTAIKSGVGRLLAQTGVRPARIKAVSCTGQWSGTVAVDEDGRHLHPAIIWMDARGAPYVRRITGGPLKFEGYGLDKVWHWVRRTGGIPTHSGKDSIAHILYLKNQNPDLYRRVYKFLEPKDYLNLRLTGRFATSAETITLHWVTDNRDIQDIDYDSRLLQMAGIPRDKLPEIKQATDILGPIHQAAAAELGLSSQTQVVMGTPDLHSAAIGSGAVADFAGHLYVGTSSWLTCHVPFKKTDLLHNMAALPSAIPGRYFIVNEQESAGACLTYLRDNLLFAQDAMNSDDPPDDFFVRLNRIAAEVPAGSDRLLFTPWLNGERTPVDDHVVRGGFHNLSLQHTRAHFVRAVLEGVALNSRWLCGYVEKFTGRPFSHLNFIGGGAKSAVWSQIFANVLNRPIHQMAEPIQANTRGAAILAGVSLGLTTFAAAAEQTDVSAVFHPEPTLRETYDNLFTAYKTIYKQNRKLHGLLQRTSSKK